MTSVIFSQNFSRVIAGYCKQ